MTTLDNNLILKYREMFDLDNITNISNNTILNGDVSLSSSLIILSNMINNNNTTLNSNLNINNNSIYNLNVSSNSNLIMLQFYQI